MTILKIGKRYINTAHVTQVVDSSYDGTPRCIITLLSHEPLDNGATLAETITFRDSEAVALLEWLDANSIDVLWEMAHRAAGAEDAERDARWERDEYTPEEEAELSHHADVMRGGEGMKE